MLHKHVEWIVMGRTPYYEHDPFVYPPMGTPGDVDPLAAEFDLQRLDDEDGAYDSEAGTAHADEEDEKAPINSSFQMYLEEAYRTPLLPAAEQIDLAIRAKSGDIEAKHRLIEATQRLVMSCAARLRRADARMGDLVQEGNLGLIHAIETFDPRRGNVFVTHATRLIEQAINAAIRSDRPIPIPYNAARTHRLINNLRMRYYQEHEAWPTMAQLQVESKNELGRGVPGTLKYVEAAIDIGSLDVPMAADEDITLLDTIPAKALPEEIEVDQLRQRIEKYFGNLTVRRAAVLAVRYGLTEEGEEHSVAETGKILGTSRQNIRWLEKEALSQLHVPELHELFLRLERGELIVVSDPPQNSDIHAD